MTWMLVVFSIGVINQVRANLTISCVVICAENWNGLCCNMSCNQMDRKCDFPMPCHDNCVGLVCRASRHCVDGVDVYVRTCDAGFVGRQCEVNVDKCKGVNCSGNGRCIEEVNSFSCECDAGYSGVMCEIVSKEDTPGYKYIIIGKHTH